MKLFVYGTLKKNQYNHKLLKNSKFIEEYSIPGYTLYDTGLYPVAIESEVKNHEIKGEVYEIDSNVWGVIYNMEKYAGYKSRTYNDMYFFVYSDWLKATTKFKHIGATWLSKK